MINNLMQKIKFQIDNLSLHDKNLLDEIWSKRSEREFEEWYLLLSEVDQFKVQSLMILLNYEILDKIVTKESLIETQKIISKFINNYDSL
jgi:hypothetical protein